MVTESIQGIPQKSSARESGAKQGKGRGGWEIKNISKSLLSTMNVD